MLEVLNQMNKSLEASVGNENILNHCTVGQNLEQVIMANTGKLLPHQEPIIVQSSSFITAIEFEVFALLQCSQSIFKDTFTHQVLYNYNYPIVI